MATEKPVVLIIGGGWHTPESYGKLVKALESAGHEVHCPRHPSTNQSRPPTAGLSEDSANIRSYVEELVDSGRRVVAVMHSYGGQVGTNALVGLGLSNEDIANRMSVSLNTVKTHLKHIYRKLDVSGRGAAVAAAERLHLL